MFNKEGKNMERKQTSITRYLGCSGNVLIFSDNSAADGDKTKTDAQEQPKSDTKEEEEETSSAIAV